MILSRHDSVTLRGLCGLCVKIFLFCGCGFCRAVSLRFDPSFIWPQLSRALPLSLISSFSWFGALVLSIVLLSSCSSPQKVSYVQPSTDAVPAHAYALLYDLLGNEKDVAKLRIIKHERPELGALIKQISNVSRDAHHRLEQFAKADPSLNLKDLGLPPGEVEARKAISSTKTKSLLGSKGKEFEVHLLLSQSEALTYGAHLARIIASRETNPDRAEFAKILSDQFTELEEHVFAMLAYQSRNP